MTTRKTRGVPAGTKIYTQGVDPFVVQLRTEQVRRALVTTPWAWPRA
jgi:hypothetical protein